MELTVQLHLPGEAGSVAAARQMLREALSAMGTGAGEIHAHAHAWDQACADALRHATAGEDITVSAVATQTRCRIQTLSPLRPSPGALSSP